MFSVWATTENVLVLKNSTQEDVTSRFDDESSESPYPHRTLGARASGPNPRSDAAVGQPSLTGASTRVPGFPQPG